MFSRFTERNLLWWSNTHQMFFFLGTLCWYMAAAATVNFLHVKKFEIQKNTLAKLQSLAVLCLHISLSHESCFQILKRRSSKIREEDIYAEYGNKYVRVHTYRYYTYTICRRNKESRKNHDQSITPVLLRTTKHYKASKTSISCEASATFQATSFQNERFVRGFRNFASNKLPKRAFRARLPQLFKRQASKTSVSCEASATFQATSFQNERFVRGFRNFSKKKLPKSCACHAKRENDLSPWKFAAPKRAFRARLPSNSTLSTWKSTISCEFFL